VKQRKRTTVQDYQGYLRRHLVPYSGERTLDRIEPEHVEGYIQAKLTTLSPPTVTNHLTFLHGLFAFAIRRRWTQTNPVALVDRPLATRQHGPESASCSPSRSRRCPAPCPTMSSAQLTPRSTCARSPRACAKASCSRSSGSTLTGSRAASAWRTTSRAPAEPCPYCHAKRGSSNWFAST
jgi:hypothetical protein